MAVHHLLLPVPAKPSSRCRACDLMPLSECSVSPLSQLRTTGFHQPHTPPLCLLQAQAARVEPEVNALLSLLVRASTAYGLSQAVPETPLFALVREVPYASTLR